MVKTLTDADLRAALATVMDPEIPVVSIVDLGIVERIALSDREIQVDILPTFSGCPALDVIRDDVARALSELAGDRLVTVRFVNDPPWTTDRMTEAARAALAEYGIAPPGARQVLQIGRKPEAAACPYCGSGDTVVENAFGPTLCRTILYCRGCRNPFEGFKRKG